MENATVEVQGLSIADPKCSNCLISDKKLFSCGKCLCAKYCSKECQRAHWTLHKLHCKDYESAVSKIEKYKLKSIQYDNEGNYRKSGEYLTYIYQYYMKELGENDDKTCTALCDLASNYHKQKKYKDADVLFRSVFTPLEKKLANRGPDFRLPYYIIELMNGYAVNLVAMEDYESAINIFNKVIQISSKESIDLRIACTANLATAMINSNKLKEADEILQSLLKETRSTHGNEHNFTLQCMNSIGTLYIKFNRYVEAEAIWTECFELQKKSLGINHPFTLSTLNNICHSFIHQRKFDEAVTACKLCLDKRKLVLGDDNRDTLFSMHNLGTVCLATKNYVEAEKILTECLIKMKTILGNNDNNTIGTAKALIKLYEQTGRNKEALKLRKTL